MASMKEGPLAPDYSSALTMDALYDLLEGKCVEVARQDGKINLQPKGDQLHIQQKGSAIVHKVWMAELALAWNMLSGYGNRSEVWA